MSVEVTKKANVKEIADDFSVIVEQETRKELLKEMKKEARKVFSRVNKRINRLIASDAISPALEGLFKRHYEGFHFTYGGTDLDSLSKMLSEAYIFESRETSTVTGAKLYTNNLKRLLKDRGIKDDNYINNVFDLMRGVSERVPVQLAENMIGTDLILNQINESYTQQEIAAMSEADRERMIEEQLAKLQLDASNAIYEGLSDIESSFL